MPSFNRVTLMGNLTRDPQVKHLPSNTTVADFGLAMNRRYKTASGEEREEVCFVDCAAFGKQAEVIGQYCKKGRQLFVEGRLKFDTWDDKSNISGSSGKRSKLSVVVEHFQFLGGRDGADGPSPTSGPSSARQRTFSDRRPEPAASKSVIDDDAGFTDADIPF